MISECVERAILYKIVGYYGTRIYDVRCCMKPCIIIIWMRFLGYGGGGVGLIEVVFTKELIITKAGMCTSSRDSMTAK